MRSRRFAPPAVPQHPGVRHRTISGAVDTAYPQTPAEISDESLLGIMHAGETEPPGEAGWYGIRSRSRFLPPSLGVIGHLDEPLSVYPDSNGPDPAGTRTQFPPPDPLYSLSEAPTRGDSHAGLQDRTIELAREGRIDYVRDVFNPVDSPGVRYADPIRWGDPPVPRAFRRSIFTLRREFEQFAQSFGPPFLHTRIQPGAKVSHSTARMGPPRTNRLTNRELPGSFGQETEVIGGRG